MNVPVVYNKARVRREYDINIVTEIVVPEGVIQIDNSTFKKCRNFVSISLPNSLTRIGHHAFNNCTSLGPTINIPPSVRYIVDWAFSFCSSLATVNVHPSTDIHPYAFSYGCTALHNLAEAQNLSIVPYIREQNRIKARIDLRVAVFMCTNSKVRYDFNVPQTQDKLPTIANGELDGVLALRLLDDDVWRVIVQFL